jgi:protein SCO1/2
MNSRLIVLVAAVFTLGTLVALTAFGTLQISSLDTGATMTRVRGKALIGGPFTLVDHDGKRVTEKDFQGRYMLVFFGYTHCPDVCPTELQVMTSALELLGAKADKVTPVFISIDPERDTVEEMASYISNFHKRFVGLTGSQKAIHAAAKAYRIYYAKAKDDGSNTDYLMDHSSIVYFMNTKGEFITHFSHGTSPEKMAAGMAKFL